VTGPLSRAPAGVNAGRGDLSEFLASDSHMPHLRAVLFDLDDTLFDHRQTSIVALDALCARYPELGRLPRAVLERENLRLVDELHAEVLAGVLSMDGARVVRFERLFALAGAPADRGTAEGAAACYRQSYLALRRPLPGAVPLLEALHGRVRIGVVSNNLLAEQRDKLRVCGLASFVDALVVSEEVGCLKPDPRIFLTALERLDCTAAEAVMVGDSWPVDVLGARAAGVRALWLNRSGLSAPDPGLAREIAQLEPLDAVLQLLAGD
jgi:putative hydrolase of the HAD superfamily